MKTCKELIDHIELKQIDKTTFEGFSISVGSEAVFGGQALAQALNAAYRTVPENRTCHSLHSYFLLRGDLTQPILYKVQLIRDGGSFTTRYVTAEQEGKIIFVMAASFQTKEEGYDFQSIMPTVTSPDELMSWEDIYEQTKDILPKAMTRFLGLERPIIFKPTSIINPLAPEDLEPNDNIWFKIKDVEKGVSLAHLQQMLAYVSDYNILFAALRPHASTAHFTNMQLASLDHAMWFHREPEDYSGWFLYNLEVMSNSNARGLVTGKIYSEKGELIATTTQEGLMRNLRK